MARGNCILINGTDPKGRMMEGIVAGAYLPGTVVQLDPSVALKGGRHTWTVFNADADGTRPKGPYIILTEDAYQGKTATTAYTAGDRAFGFVPIQGDEINLVLLDVAGTGDDHTKGEMLMVDDTTGKFIATASSGAGFPESECAQLLETVTDPAADTLAWCIWTGY